MIASRIPGFSAKLHGGAAHGLNAPIPATAITDPADLATRTIDGTGMRVCRRGPSRPLPAAPDSVTCTLGLLRELQSDAALLLRRLLYIC